MFFTLKTILRTLLLPPAGPLLLAAFGAWLALRRGAGAAARRAGWACVITSLATLWLLSTPVVAEGLMRLAERYPALDLTRPPACSGNRHPGRRQRAGRARVRRTCGGE